MAATAAALHDTALATQAKAAAAAHAIDAAAAAAVAAQRGVLASRPTDPAANAAVGRFECLTADDWAAGLPHLAAGDDPLLKAAAADELAGPTSADARVAAGDAWRAAAKAAAAAPVKSKLMARAAHWYALAATDATGLVKAKVEARLREATPPPPSPPVPARRRSSTCSRSSTSTANVTDGSWTARGGDLVSGDARACRVDLPYRPSPEYDLRVTFTRTGGDDAMDVIGLAGAGGRRFAYTVAGLEQHDQRFRPGRRQGGEGQPDHHPRPGDAGERPPVHARGRGPGRPRPRHPRRQAGRPRVPDRRPRFAAVRPRAVRPAADAGAGHVPEHVRRPLRRRGRRRRPRPGGRPGRPGRVANRRHGPVHQPGPRPPHVPRSPCTPTGP